MYTIMNIGVTCGDPPDNGLNASPLTPTNTTYQGTVLYTCHTGYYWIPNGVTTATATCMADRRWGPLPTCQRMKLIPDCIIMALFSCTHSVVDCGSPPTITDGSPGTPNPGTMYQGTVLYTCDSGYEVSNGVTTATATCMDNGDWTPLPITCTSMVQEFI